MSFVGAWEPLSFRRRSGYAYTDEDTFSAEEEFSDKALDQYLSTGANGIVIPFAKGFGLKQSAQEFAGQSDLARRCHAKGLTVGAYIRVDAIVPELVRADFPNVDEWLTVGMYGRTSPYAPQQTFRKRVCYFHPDALRWLENLFILAAREMEADLLHLDGFAVAHFPWETCRCLHCLDAYRNWLKLRFANKAQRQRVFGVVDFEAIEFPEFEPNGTLPTVLSSPDMQVWHQFQWDKALAFTRHIRRFIRQLGSHIAVTANPGWDRSTHIPRAWNQSIEQLLPWLDAIWTEDHFHLDYRDGRIRSRLSTFKTAREHDIPVCHYHWSSDPGKIEASLALSLAANDGNPSCLGFTFRYLPHYTLANDIKRRYTSWAEAHKAILQGTIPFGEIALVRHFPSLAWNAKDPWFSLMSMEQLLIRKHLSWRVLSTISKDLLCTVKTLILPDAESLSDAEISTLKGWVAAGGRLLFTARTATHDEYRRRRPRHGILQWLENRADSLEDAIRWYNWSKEDFTEFPLRESGLQDVSEIYFFGAGALGYWPHIEVSGKGCLANRRMNPGELLPPDNAGEIYDFLSQLHGAFEFSVDAPDSLLVETAFQPKTNEMLIHLIQVDANGEPIQITLDRKEGWEGAGIYSPDQHHPQLEIADTLLHVRSLKRYAVVVVSISR